MLPTAPSVRLTPAEPHPFEAEADVLWRLGWFLEAGYERRAGVLIPFLVLRGARPAPAGDVVPFSLLRANDHAVRFRRLGWSAICRSTLNDATGAVLLYAPLPSPDDGYPGPVAPGRPLPALRLLA